MQTQKQWVYRGTSAAFAGKLFRQAGIQIRRLRRSQMQRAHEKGAKSPGPRPPKLTVSGSAVLKLQRRHEVEEVRIVPIECRVLSHSIAVPEPAVTNLKLQVIRRLIRSNEVKFRAQIR